MPVAHNPNSPFYVVERSRWRVIDGKAQNAQAVHDYFDLISRWVVGHFDNQEPLPRWSIPMYGWSRPEDGAKGQYDAILHRHANLYSERRGLIRINYERPYGKPDRGDGIMEAFIALTFTTAEDAARARQIIDTLVKPNPELMLVYTDPKRD